jgi:2-polyprenyl-6-methoxyphenol hydroxylase-like FAD-dependent oxidoreductase
MKVLIVGAGIAGLTLALCLRREGHAAVLLERAPRLRGEGYMIDFFGSGYDAAERLALLPELEKVHYPIESLAFLGEHREERVRVPYARMRALLGGRHFNFMRGDLERVLWLALGGTQAPVRFGTTLDSFEDGDEHVDVTLTGGQRERFDLVVGADGVRSRTRTLLFGEGPFVRDLGYHTAAYVFDDPELREELGSRFLTLSAPGRQVGAYPIRGGRVATFWIHRSAAPVDDASATAALDELRAVYGSLGWLVPRLLDGAKAAPSVYFDTVSQVVVPKWSRGRVALVGDACQCVSLVAGQGASMAMAGAYVLAEELAAHGSDVATALTRYEDRLAPAIAKKQRAGRSLARWFVPESGLRMGLRDLALRASSSSLGAWLLRRQIAGESVITAR